MEDCGVAYRETAISLLWTTTTAASASADHLQTHGRVLGQVRLVALDVFLGQRERVLGQLREAVHGYDAVRHQVLQ